MNKLIKTMVTVLSGVIVLTSAATVLANEAEKEYASVSGKITNITKYENTGFNNLDGQYLVLVENEDGKIMNFRITDNTYMFSNEEPTIGKQAVGFYDNKSIAILIYPPQMPAVAFAVSPNEQETITAGYFNKDLINEDNTLKLNVSESTEIITAEGMPYEGEITNKNLAVLYTVTTRSIPAQTTPIRIIVLPDKDNPIPSEPDETRDNGMIIIGEDNGQSMDTTLNLEGIEILVNGKKLDSAQAFSKNGVVMVPLRASAEALGYKIEWNAANKTITLNSSITVTVDKDFYTYAEATPINLGTAPIIKDDITYVPIEFFTDVAMLNSAQLIDQQVVLDNN